MEYLKKFGSLQERIDARNKITQETGHYWGIKELSLNKQDPVKFNRFNSRIVAAVTTARETAKFVSASPSAVSMGELVFGLMTTEGDCMSASLGLVGHSAGFPIIIEKFAKLKYDVKTGVNDGDVWDVNDPLYGAVHAADCVTFLPIVYKDEHIGWAAGVNHIGEVGAMIPGSVPTIAPNIFVEGHEYSITKSGENLQYYPWWEEEWRRRTRSGDMAVFDAKMRLAGVVMLRNRILEICEEFGTDYVKEAFYEIMERERATMQKILTERTMPGRYSFPFLQPVRYKGKLGDLMPEANKDWLTHWPLEFTLSEGRIKYDLSGSSAEDWHHYNMYEGALKFGLNLGWFFLFLVGENVHTANMYLFDIIRPEGSVANPTNPFVGTPCGAVSGCRVGEGSMFRIIAKSMWAKGFLEETMVFEASDYNIYGMSGVFDNGKPWAMSNFSLAGGQATGARAYMDGGVCDAAGNNPESDFGEAEMWETLEPPLLMIMRGMTKDYVAHGRYRGSVGYTLGFVVNQPGKSFQFNDSCAMAEVSQHCLGANGGYPGLAHASLYFKKTNMVELMKKGQYPSTLEELNQWFDEGRLTAEKVIKYQGETPPIMLEHGDIVVIIAHGVEGWGEPLDRDTRRIETDLNNNFISPATAEEIYGTVVKRDAEGAWKADAKATTEIRAAMRTEREQFAIPVAEWWQEERRHVVNKKFDPLVAEMYDDCITNPQWGKMFRDFWGVDDSYSALPGK